MTEFPFSKQSLYYVVFHLSFHFRLCRGSTPSRYEPSDPLPGRRVPFSHYRDRLPDEAHLDDHDRRLQVCQNQEAHYLPKPQLHGSAVGVWGGPQQRNHATNPHTKAHGCGDHRLNEPLDSMLTLVLTLTVFQERPAARWAGLACERAAVFFLNLLMLILDSLGVPKLWVSGDEKCQKSVWTWPKSRRRRRVREIETERKRGSGQLEAFHSWPQRSEHEGKENWFGRDILRA